MPDAACARRRRAPPFTAPSGYARHRPESTLLYQLVEQHYPGFNELRAREGRSLPDYVQEEFDAYLRCGRLEEGFLRVRCEGCHAEKLVAFSCKKRGFCPSCGGRRMAETAALLADEVLPERPLRQWVLSLPFALRLDPNRLVIEITTDMEQVADPTAYVPKVYPPGGDQWGFRIPLDSPEMRQYTV